MLLHLLSHCLIECLSPSAPIVNNLVLSPVIDGDFLPDEPQNLFINAAEIDYIAGANDMDGHIFTGLDVPSVNQPIQSTPLWVLNTHIRAVY